MQICSLLKDNHPVGRVTPRGAGPGSYSCLAILCLALLLISTTRADHAADTPLTPPYRYKLEGSTPFVAPFRDAFHATFEVMYFTEDQLFQIALESDTEIHHLREAGTFYVIRLNYFGDGDNYMRGASGNGPFMAFRYTESGLEHALNFSGSEYRFVHDDDKGLLLEVSIHMSVMESPRLIYRWTAAKFEIVRDEGEHWIENVGTFRVVRHHSKRRSPGNAPHTVLWFDGEGYVEVLSFNGSDYHLEADAQEGTTLHIFHDVDGAHEASHSYRWRDNQFVPTKPDPVSSPESVP